MRNTEFLAALILPLCLFGAPLAAQEAAPGAEAGTDAPAEAEAPAPEEQAADNVTVASGIGVFGPPALPEGFANLPYVNPDAPKGGEFSMSWTGGFDSLNPYTVKGRPALMSSIMHEPLMEGSAAEIGAAYCLVCETIEYPESRDWVIFNLRPEAAFSDGTPVTAEDVLFSYETLRTKGLNSFRTVIAQSIAGAEVLDDHRIRFDFVEGYPRRDVIQGAASLPVFSRKDFEDNDRDFEASTNKAFIGSGPYMFDRMDTGRTIVWKRNPDYWGKDLPLNKGRHNYDRIRIEYFADSDSAFEAFKAGEYTFRQENSAIQWATGYGFPGVQNGSVLKVALPDGSKAPAQGFFINLRREKFQDIRVREAIGLMFNFEWADKALFYDLYTRIESFWDNSYLKAEGKPSEGELALLEPLAADLPDGILTEDAVLPAKGGERQLDRAALRKAAALLDEAGWVPGSDGMRRNSDGQVLSVEFMNDSQAFDRVINPYVENLRALGVDARMARVDDAEYETRRYEFDYDIMVTHAFTDMIAGDGLYQMFGSQGVNDVFNASGLSNPAIDKLIGAAVAAETEDDMVTATHALDRSLRALRIWVPNWYNADNLVAYYDMYEHPAELPPYLLGQLDFWWYNAEKAEKLKASGALR
ncbi:ABC transporter substrate-binding protein [Paracoccus aurantiacus]|uniref:ABC transporter substrate-binding protein n=1 Tax=Paracoccus aurantiacus TaxID=2599412 RepID=A0A5C6SB75_9RHOB|nr:extracellular solute-binding protein [Paracoccus aurantiacus]TXB71043.1 ABC transporter substrate-binding protein [Paracoccus aurantiacus]